MASKKKATKKAVVEESQPSDEFEDDFETSGILNQISEMPEGDDDLEDVEASEDEDEKEYYLDEEAEQKLSKIVEEKTADISVPAIIHERGMKEGAYEPTEDYPTANHFLNRVKATKNKNIVERTPEHNPFLIIRDDPRRNKKYNKEDR